MYGVGFAMIIIAISLILINFLLFMSMTSNEPPPTILEQRIELMEFAIAITFISSFSNGVLLSVFVLLFGIFVIALSRKLNR